MATMQDASQMQDRLRSLSIPREQRPGAKTGVPRRRWGLLVTLLILVILAAAGYVAWRKLRPGGVAAPFASADGQPIRLLKVTPRNPADADAVLAASVFHFGTYTVREVKEAMARAGVPVRL